MKRVLILGDSSDPHTIAVTAALALHNVTPQTVDIWAPFQPISYPDKDQAKIGIWIRLKPRSRDSISEQESFCLRERKEFLLGYVLHRADAQRTMNDPWKQERARNKLIQLQVAEQAEFLTPATVIGNDVSAIENLCHAHESIIYKAITWLAASDGKILFTNEISLEQIRDNSALLGNVPGIYQERVEKAYEYRVTVVDSVIFAVRIYSQVSELTKLDWRRDQVNTKYEVCSLPPAIESRIGKMMELLGIKFGAFDLIEKPNGEFVFLEVNPAGNWLWLEERLGLPVSQQIAKFLAGADGDGPRPLV